MTACINEMETTHYWNEISDFDERFEDDLRVVDVIKQQRNQATTNLTTTKKHKHNSENKSSAVR